MRNIPLTKEIIKEYLIDLDEEVGLKGYSNKVNFVVFGASAFVLMGLFEREATYDIDILYKETDKSSFGDIEQIIDLDDGVLNSRGIAYVSGILEYEEEWYEIESVSFDNIKVLLPSLEMLCTLKLGAAALGNRYHKDMNDISTEQIWSKVNFEKIKEYLLEWKSYEKKNAGFIEIYEEFLERYEEWKNKC